MNKFRALILDQKILLVPFCVFLFLFSGCAVSNHPQRVQMKRLQKGIIKDDTSFVYELPYEENESRLLVQGYFSMFTHKHRAALDFKLKSGTKISAVRAGVVIRIKDDGERGGTHIKNRKHGNYIVIQHQDSSRSGYWHLRHKAIFVKVGDTVKAGQPIGLSGKTGYTYFPHLHFIVWRYDRNGKWTQVGTRFNTSQGIRYLRPLRYYRKPK